MHVTLAIATWNRAALLRQTLASVGGLRLPDQVTLQVLVCDNRSTDATRAVIEGAVFPWGRPIYLYEPTPGKSQALNRMLAAARGDWVLFLDDDVRVPPELIEAYMEGVARYPAAVALGGPIQPWPGQSAGYAPRQQALLAHSPASFGAQFLERDTLMNPPAVSAWGANMMLRRSTIPPEGFALDQGMIGKRRVAGEDVGMIEQVLRHSGGGEGWLLARAKVEHYTPPAMVTLRRLWRWQEAIGARWKAERGEPTPGRWGVPWWAWQEMLRRAGRALWRWRPGLPREFLDAFVAAAQWRGYLRK